MDFSFTPEQDEAGALAARIIGDATTREHLAAVENTGERFDLALWRALGDAGLLALHLPEVVGGAGFGLIELARVVVEAGRRVAPVPVGEHAAVSALLADVGTAAQQERWLPDAAAGRSVLSAAVAEELDPLPPVPATVAVVSRVGGSAPRWTVTGRKALVRAGAHAAAFVVSASTSTGTGLFLVPAGAPGLTLTPQRTSDGDVVTRLDLADVPAEALGPVDGIAAARLGQLLTGLACAELLGVTEEALRATAEYARTREQFGRAIGSFQAVAQRLADGYIDVLGQRLTAWKAVWQLAEGRPAEIEVAVAKLWAADAAHRLAHTAVHVHGGVGIDLDGPVHRYFTAAKRFEFAYGGATEQALLIGRALVVAAPVAGALVGRAPVD